MPSGGGALDKPTPTNGGLAKKKQPSSLGPDGKA